MMETGGERAERRDETNQREMTYLRDGTNQRDRTKLRGGAWDGMPTGRRFFARRKTELPPFAPVPLTDEREWTEDGAPVLRAAVSLLVPEGKQWRRIAWFYRMQCRSFLKYCQGDLLPWARAEARRAAARSVPVPCFRAELTCRETYRAGRLWSLYTQVWDNAAPGASTLRRWGDIWDLYTGRPVPAAALFAPRDRWKRRVLAGAEAAFAAREEQGRARFRPDWRRALRRSWNARNCYLTAEGLAFFWPMYALAPAAEGLPTYTVPFGEGLSAVPCGEELSAASFGEAGQEKE